MRRAFRALAGAALLAVALAATACSTTDSPGEQSDGKTTLTIWVPSLIQGAAKEFPSRFAQTDPDVSVNVVVIPNPFENNVLTKWAAGERPDILYFHGIGNFLAQLNPAKNLVDLSDRPFVGATLDGLLDNSTEFDGKIYGALVDFPGVDGVLYNKPVFDRLGLTAPNNFDDLLKLCDTIRAKDPKVAPIELAGGDKWPLQILAFQLFTDGLKANPGLIDDVNSNKATFNDPVFVAGYQGLKTAYERKCFNDDIKTASFENSQKRMISGEAAMTPTISVQTSIFVDAFGAEEVDKNLGFFPIAKDSNTAAWQTTGQAIYVPQTNEPARIEKAKAFVDWITSAQVAQEYVDSTKQYPVFEGVNAPTGIPLPLQEAYTAFQAGAIPQYQQNLKAAYGEFADYLGEMLFAGQSPQWVGEQMQTTFARNAKAQGLAGF
ncbi:ABC transporter substrate-binding protein [Phytohabitans kaempferiae]|uniref:Extracellular solute-binding protein n=1 Tax=Phytohabitans kaempferiae TaxID=1620943 RepID=A0ABV6M488_9ACTN